MDYKEKVIALLNSKELSQEQKEKLESIFPELAEQKPTAWSEEDDDDAWLNDIISKAECDLQLNKDEIDWLKSIISRQQPKQEWSEEDDRMYNRIVSFIPQHLTAESYTACINWLKSLRPQNRWKPSDEQIKVCKEVYADILSAKGFNIGTVNSELNRMEEELKKLREEL
jgi:hypothetical protein